MSVYVLDTDTLSLFQQGQAEVVRRCLAQPPDRLAVTILTVQEQTLGWYTRLTRCRRDDETARIYQRWCAFVAIVGQLRVWSFSEPAIRRYRQLEGLRLNVGKMDLRIAAVVLEEQGTLVTRNARDFGRVPGLVQVDWSV